MPNPASKIPKQAYCPICAQKMQIQTAEGKLKMICSEHGEMRCYLPKNPYVPDSERKEQNK